MFIHRGSSGLMARLSPNWIHAKARSRKGAKKKRKETNVTRTEIAKIVVDAAYCIYKRNGLPDITSQSIIRVSMPPGPLTNENQGGDCSPFSLASVSAGGVPNENTMWALLCFG